MIKSENYFVVHGWMITDLKLSGISLQVYAIIHGFSQDEKSVFNGGKQYLMDWTGYERRQITSVLQDLTKQGLLERIQGEVHGHEGYVYRTSAKFAPVQNSRQCNNYTNAKNTLDISAKFAPDTSAKNAPELVQNLHPSTLYSSYSPNDLPQAPYNNIKKDIKKNNKEEEEKEERQPRQHSFSFQDNGKAIISLPCTDGELTFSGEDVKDLQAAFVDLNIIAELKQIALKFKTCKVDLTADKARRYVNSWMVNSQNKRASSSNVWQNTTSQTMSPEDPRNPFTHPEYDREGNKLDYDGNIIKTAQEIRTERKAEEDRKEAERIAYLNAHINPELLASATQTKPETSQPAQPIQQPKKPYWEMTETELKALLKPLEGEELWQYKVRTEKIKNQLTRLEKMKQQKAV